MRVRAVPTRQMQHSSMLGFRGHVIAANTISDPASLCTTTMARFQAPALISSRQSLPVLRPLLLLRGTRTGAALQIQQRPAADCQHPLQGAGLGEHPEKPVILQALGTWEALFPLGLPGPLGPTKRTGKAPRVRSSADFRTNQPVSPSIPCISSGPQYSGNLGQVPEEGAGALIFPARVFRRWADRPAAPPGGQPGYIAGDRCPYRAVLYLGLLGRYPQAPSR